MNWLTTTLAAVRRRLAPSSARPPTIFCHWNPAAGVWMMSSSDFPGLTAECRKLDDPCEVLPERVLAILAYSPASGRKRSHLPLRIVAERGDFSIGIYRSHSP